MYYKISEVSQLLGVHTRQSGDGKRRENKVYQDSGWVQTLNACGEHVRPSDGLLDDGGDVCET